jgi:hypothetical protein
MSKWRSVVALVGTLIVAAVILGSVGSADALFFRVDRTMYYEGTGQVLIYPFWIADGTTDTLFEIVNRLTALNQAGLASPSGLTNIRKARYVLVHITIHEEKNSEDVRDFNVCLSPGDVWTATLTLVGGVTHMKSTDLSTTDLGPAPVDVTLAPCLTCTPPGTNPTRGYVEAVMIDNGTSEGAGCDTLHESTNPDTGLRDDAVFDNNTQHQGVDNPLFGRTLLVNVGNGIVTGFNAEALEDYCNTDPGVDCLGLASIKGSARAFQALALADASRSVRGTLLGRFVRDAAHNFETQVVVTFPTGKNHKFGFCSGDTTGPFNAPFGTTDCTGKAATQLDFSITATTTMALWVRNDEECVNISPRQIPVPNEVNFISFIGLPDTLFRTTASNPGGGVCKKPEIQATGGWFRLLFDTNEDEVTDRVTGSATTFASGPATQSVFVPRVIPAVSVEIISALTPGQGRVSASFPLQSEAPHDFFDCNNTGGTLECYNSSFDAAND